MMKNYVEKWEEPLSSIEKGFFLNFQRFQLKN